MPPGPPGGRLTTGPIPRHVLSLTLPMVWGIMAVISKSIVDTYFVAQLGTDPLSAMGFMFPVMMVVANLAIGLGAGTSVVVARCIGEGDPDRVRRRATDGLILAIILVTATALAGLLTMDPLFVALGAPEAVLVHIHEYMRVWYWGMGFLVVPMVGNGIIRATGDARIPSMIMIGSAAFNAALDPILIFGLLGVPKLGIAGAALATVISNVLAFSAALAVLTFRERLLDLRVPKLADVLESWKGIMHIGVPASASNMINPIGTALVTAILARFGAETVAAYGVATRIQGLAVVVMLALSASVGPIVGQNAGARLHGRVKETLRFAYLSCLAWGLFAAGVLYLLGEPISAAFDDSPEVVGVAAKYLAIVPVSLVGYGVGIVSAAALNALGRPLTATMLTGFRVLGVFVPVTWIVSRSLGWEGILYGTGLANVFIGVAAIVLMRRVLRGEGAQSSG